MTAPLKPTEQGLVLNRLLAQEEYAKEMLLHAQENDQQALAIRAKYLVFDIRRKITFQC